MKKMLNIAICLFLLLVSTNFAQKQIAKQTKNKSFVNKKTEISKAGKKKVRFSQKKKAEFFCQLPASVTTIKLSQSEIVLDCPPTLENCPNNKIIKVIVTAIDTGNEKYVYNISAGKIIGEGANVEWDLTDVKPGTYTITTGISQLYSGFGWQVYGETKTKIVKIKDYADYEEK